MASFRLFEFARAATSDTLDATTTLALLGDDIVYPGLRAPISDDALIDEALRDHPDARERMAQMEEMELDDSLDDALLEVMSDEFVLFDAA